MGTKTFSVDEVRISDQTEQEVLNTSPKWFTIPSASCNVKATEGLIDIDSLSSGAEPVGSFLSGIDDIAGSISFNMQYALMRWIMESAVGEGTTVDLATSAWATGVVVEVGDVVNGTTPATDDLVVFEITGAGTTGATAPDTAALLDGDTVQDNEVTWIVRKASILKTTGGISRCQRRFAIEVKISSECDNDVFYFRKLGCVIGSPSFTFAKDGSLLKTDLSIIGAIAEDNIKADGSVDTSYEDFSTIAGNTELELENGIYIKQSDLDYTLNGVASEATTSFSLNLDNGTNKENLLSKIDGKNTKAIYSSKRKLTGSVESFFDTVLFGKMDGTTTNEAIVTMDMGNGEYLSIKQPHIKFSKNEPDFGNDTLKISPEYSAEYKEADGSALQYEIHTTGIAYN